jgi:hypothetical protein
MKIKPTPAVQQTCRDQSSRKSRTQTIRQTTDEYKMAHGITLRMACVLLVSGSLAGNPTDRNNDSFFTGALAQELRPKGDLIKGEVKPYGEIYVFTIRRGAGNKIIDG